MSDKRRYDDPCGIARGLNVIGERWALLVVRELLFGPKRFTDLRHGLPTASQNVLSQRLRELEAGGVVRRRRLGPPAATWVYELTEWGRGLEPVLFHLGRWGSRSPRTSGNELSTDALMLALRTSFDADAARDGTWELRLGDDRFRAVVADGRLRLERGGADEPDAVLVTDVATLRSVAFGDRALDEAAADGALRVEGDEEAAARFAASFRRPAPLEPAETR
ncbi:winged helix-turn-helix transcriptional regulator [Actinoallomurus sp. CA-142502]|uniref:winged helix-turn-helix transcriptional regulator n=1 Tax=Actinoallomurus sp. CA-142502 TaxID=3239885 RepID=UPI003D8EFD50